MPNHYTAMALACATGCFLRTGGGRRLAYAGVVGGLAAAALMRPNDAVWPGLVLLAAAPLVHGRPAGHAPAPAAARVRRAGAAVCAGLALGLAPWAVEAWLRYDGMVARLREAGEIQGGMRPTFALPLHAAALDGPLLCRPCDGFGVGWASAGWWLLIPPLTALGLYAAARAGRRAYGLLPAAAALAVAAPYLFFLDYAAPRFLMPAYALLAPVVAEGAYALAARFRAGVLLPVGGAALLAAHAGVQLHQVETHSGIQAEAREDWRRTARVLRAHGVAPPCVLRGNSSVIPIAYTAGCRAGPRGSGAPGPGGEPEPSALVLRGRPLPPWAAAAGWRAYPVPGTYHPGWRVAVPPRAVSPRG
ncbi:hypothetical protein G5C65_36185 [Streptomyces sp. SB3404]|uniref:Integral membrane protein n=2 Tax=Streptomyces boncukensis TaxID=2711219 RepID=A0A6G4XAA0_9ACTN|nr:hypothetical protein [Streptomyces boncukensis]